MSGQYLTVFTNYRKGKKNDFRQETEKMQLLFHAEVSSGLNPYRIVFIKKQEFSNL